MKWKTLKNLMNRGLKFTIADQLLTWASRQTCYSKWPVWTLDLTIKSEKRFRYLLKQLILLKYLYMTELTMFAFSMNSVKDDAPSSFSLLLLIAAANSSLILMILLSILEHSSFLLTSTEHIL